MKNVGSNPLIDLHCHMLPAVDDGAKSLSESLDMIRVSVDQGVTKIIMTPHVQTRMQKTSRNAQIDAYEQLLKAIAQANLNVEILLGAEIAYKAFADCPYDQYSLGKTRYLLLEFSLFEFTPIEDILFDLSRQGYVPIVAHVERYPYVTLEQCQHIKASGGLLQMNASTVIHGKDRVLKNKKLCKELLDHKLIDFVATDAHNMSDKAPNLRQAYQRLAKKIPPDYLDSLFHNNANRIFEEHAKAL